jgi:phosphatidylinositol dimannoside acyltransferase
LKAQDILGSPPFVLLGVGIARTLPRRLGYWLARQTARRMAQRRNHLFRTLCRNYTHVDPQASVAQLESMAEQALYHAGRTYFDMFRNSLRDYRTGKVTVRVDADEWAATRATFAGEHGTVLVGPHMSNFDLAMQWFEAQGIAMQVLGLAGPTAGTRVLNWVRGRRGVTLTPITVSSLRQAMLRLRAGGVVTTGVDRPVSLDDEPLPFFGTPARLPSGHVRLALQTGARILVACCLQDDDGIYRIRMAPALSMETSDNRQEDIRHNTRRVLAVVEKLIAQTPEQWLMFVPVWE